MQMVNSINNATSKIAPLLEETTKRDENKTRLKIVSTPPPTLKVKLPLLADFKELPNDLKKKKIGYDKYAYILGLMVYKAELKKISYGTYFSFDSKALRDIYGGRYSNVINALIKAEYIKEYSRPYEYELNGIKHKCKGTYKLGTIQRDDYGNPLRDNKGKILRDSNGNGKRYALNTAKFQGENEEILFREYTITNAKIVEKVTTQRIKNTQRLIQEYPTAKMMYENLKQLSINDVEAKKFLFAKYNSKDIRFIGRGLVKQLGKANTKKFITEIQATKSLRKLKPIFKKYKLTFRGQPFNDEQILFTRELLSNYNSLTKRLHTISVLKQIEQGNYDVISLSRDAKTGRLFHNLTMTPTDLKEFILLQGERPIEIDGSNAQWCLLVDYLQKMCNILYDNSFKEKQITELYLKSAFKGTHTRDTDKIDNRQTHPLHYMLHKKYDIDKFQGEITSLNEMLRMNSFRSYFVARYKDKGRNVSEKSVKAQLIKYILFGNVNEAYYNKQEIVELFKESFATIHSVLVKLKRDYLDHEAFGYEMQDQWKCLALMLQSREADIFIDGMANTNAYFCSLHDALITNESNVSKVYKDLERALKLANVKMHLKLNKY